MWVFRFYSIYWIIILFTSCELIEPACSANPGVIKEEQRAADTINSIELKDGLNLTIKPAYSPELTVAAGERLINDIETSFSGGNLTIADNNACKSLRDYDKPFEVKINSGDITEITCTNSFGSINLTDTLKVPRLVINSKSSTGGYFLIKTDELILDLEGNADWIFVGEAKNLIIRSYDIMNIDCSNLFSNQVRVDNQGQRTIKVNAKDSLWVKIESIGDVIQYGNANPSELIIDGKGEYHKR